MAPFQRAPWSDTGSDLVTIPFCSETYCTRAIRFLTTTIGIDIDETPMKVITSNLGSYCLLVSALSTVPPSCRSLRGPRLSLVALGVDLPPSKDDSRDSVTALRYLQRTDSVPKASKAADSEGCVSGHTWESVFVGSSLYDYGAIGAVRLLAKIRLTQGALADDMSILSPLFLRVALPLFRSMI